MGLRESLTLMLMLSVFVVVLFLRWHASCLFAGSDLEDLQSDSVRVTVPVSVQFLCF